MIKLDHSGDKVILITVDIRAEGQYPYFNTYIIIIHLINQTE